LKRLFLIQLLCLSILSLAFGQKPSIENGLYKISIPNDFSKNPRFTVTHKASGGSREIVPQLHVVFSEVKPELTSSSVDGYSGVVGWKTADGKIDLNIF